MKKQKEVITYKEIFAWLWIGVFLLVALLTNAIFEGYGLTNAGQIQFERPFYVGMIVAAFGGLWVVLHIKKGIKLERRFVAAFAAVLLPLVYLISSFGGATPYLSTLGIYHALILFIFFCAGALLVDYERVMIWLPKVFLVFGYLTVGYGFLNLFGNSYMLDSLSMTSEDGVRISSIFQYANAYAVLLLILWVGALIEIFRSRRIAAQVFHGAMLVPILASFLMTLSRGAMIVLPFIAIIALLMFRLKQQLIYILYSVVGMGISLAIYSSLSDRGEEVMNGISQSMAAKQPVDTVSIFSAGSISSWGLLVGAAVVMGLLTWVIQKLLVRRIRFGDKLAGSKVQLIIPFALIVAFILGAVALASNALTSILPPMLRTRLEGINLQTHSVYERLTMYKDAIKIWNLHPIFGGGGGAWEAYYERYQSYSYMSNQSHSYLTQLLVESGVVGLLVHLAIIVLAIVTFVRFFRKADEERRTNMVFYPIVVTAILMHSLIDFEMSYLFYGSLVFLCLGIMTGVDRREVALKGIRNGGQSTRYVLAGLLSVLMVMAVIQAGRGIYVDNHFKKAIAEASKPNASFPIIESELKKAQQVEANHPAVNQQLAAWYNQAFEQTKDANYLSLADKYIRRLNEKEPHYLAGPETTFVIQANEGKAEEAMKTMEDAVVNHVFTQKFYEQIASDLTTSWESAKTAGNGNASVLAQKILSNYESMKQRDQTMKDLPDTVIVSRPFELSNIVRLSAAKVLFSEKRYSEAEATLQPGLKEDLSNENDRNAALYYLASLRAQGQDDQVLYERLVQAGSGITEKLEQLLASK